MRRLTTMVLASGLAAGAALAGPGDRKPFERVSLDGLTTETQLAAEPTEGMNLVWWIPHEFWQVSLAQDPTVGEADRAAMDEALSPYFVIGVVRADISQFGEFRFHNKSEVASSMSVSYVGEDGRTVRLEPSQARSGDAVMVLNMLAPMLSAAMGSMGENFHLYLFKNQGVDGKPIVSAYEAGRLRVDLKRHRSEAGGRIDFQLPLDSLYEPFVCEKCSREGHISWNYCPWDGTRLKD
ncbi:MAG: hypothetical protein ACF8SC_01315 [Phycisphaerales bacterium JB037]